MLHKALVIMGDEPIFSKSHEMTRDEVVTTIPEMVPWGETHEELQIKKVTLMSKVNECSV